MSAPAPANRRSALGSRRFDYCRFIELDYVPMETGYMVSMRPTKGYASTKSPTKGYTSTKSPDRHSRSASSPSTPRTRRTPAAPSNRDPHGNTSLSSSSNSGSCKGSDCSPTKGRHQKYSCTDNHGIRPPPPEQYLTPLQQKEVCIRHLRARLKETINTLQDRDSEIGELRGQLYRMQEDWVEEECHRVEAQLALQEARQEIQQLKEAVDTVRARLSDAGGLSGDVGVQKYFQDINAQNHKLENLLLSMELAQAGLAKEGEAIPGCRSRVGGSAPASVSGESPAGIPKPVGGRGSCSCDGSPARSLTRSSTYTKLSDQALADRIGNGTDFPCLSADGTQDSGFVCCGESSIPSRADLLLEAAFLSEETASLLNSYAQTFSQSLPHSLPQSLAHTLPDSLPNSLPQSLPNSLPKSLPKSLPHSLPNSLPHSLPNSLPHYLPHSLPNSQCHTLPHFLPNSLPHSLPHTFSHTLPRSFPHNMSHSVAHTMPHSATYEQLCTGEQLAPIRCSLGGVGCMSHPCLSHHLYLHSLRETGIQTESCPIPATAGYPSDLDTIAEQRTFRSQACSPTSTWMSDEGEEEVDSITTTASTTTATIMSTATEPIPMSKTPLVPCLPRSATVACSMESPLCGGDEEVEEREKQENEEREKESAATEQQQDTTEISLTEEGHQTQMGSEGGNEVEVQVAVEEAAPDKLCNETSAGTLGELHFGKCCGEGTQIGTSLENLSMEDVETEELSPSCQGLSPDVELPHTSQPRRSTSHEEIAGVIVVELNDDDDEDEEQGAAGGATVDPGDPSSSGTIEKSYWSRHFLVDLLAVAIPVVPTVAWLCRGPVRGGPPMYHIGSLLRGCCTVALHSLRRGGGLRHYPAGGGDLGGSQI
ncbi:syntaphilin isoform X2 [Clinocottus analis]|uniref:syntaphilin isoform X2 n=1 Tax=Clinocottus analis TaxID=304258 RepID=UPI0035BF5E1D